MASLKQIVPYAKNVYNYQEINAVVKTLKKTTQMSKNVSEFEDKIFFWYVSGCEDPRSIQSVLKMILNINNNIDAS